MREQYRWSRTRTVRSGALVLLAVAFGLGLFAWGRWTSVAHGQGPLCAVYPIALFRKILEGATPGDYLLDIENGIDDRQFGWLFWKALKGQTCPGEPNPGSAARLADSLTYPGNSTTCEPCADCDNGQCWRGYLDPDESDADYECYDPDDDYAINVGDWVAGHTGAVNSNVVRDALDDHVDTGRTLRVVVWDAANCDGGGDECEGDAPGGGANVRYRVYGFALVKLLWYDLAQKTIAIEFVGWDNSCGQDGGVGTCDPYVDLYVSQTGNYGLEQVSNLSVYGPRICTAYGDPYTPYNSPWYDELNGVYPFRLDIPSDYESTATDLTQRHNDGMDTNDIVRVEIWDPDCYNSPDNQLTITNTFTGLPMTAYCSSSDRKNPCIPVLKDPPYNDPQNPFGFVRIDENRGHGTAPGDGQCGEPGSYDEDFNTITVYTLYYYQQGDGSLERRDLARYTKGGADSDSDTDMLWVCPGGSLPDDPLPDGWPGSPYSLNWDAGDGNFEIDLSTETPGIYVDPVDGRRHLFLGVRGVEGASENGFDLWAGPRYQTVPSEVNERNVDIILHAGDYHSSAGATFFGIGHLPMNTNHSEVVTLTLAYVPLEWAGRTLYVDQFDNDAAAQGITFTFDTMPYADWHHDGLLSGDDEWVTNVFTVPSAPEHIFYGGYLQAVYQAGAHDTFGWKMTISRSDLSGSTKEASGTMVSPGDVLTYTIVASNTGTEDASAASLSDPIPAHTTYVTGSARIDPPGSGVLTETASAVEWSGSVAANEAITLAFQVTVDPDVAEGTAIANTVAISDGACGFYRGATVLVGAPPYIVLDRTCSPEGQAADITVSGYNWLDNPNKTIIIQWDETIKTIFQSRVNWATMINISASEATSGTHTVRAFIQSPLIEDSKSVVIPCPPTPYKLYLPFILKEWPAEATPTPTATPLRPDLRITNIDVSPSSPITAYVPVTFTVGIVNDGQGDALSLFWVDLYDRPEGSDPPTAGQSQDNVTWKAVSSLGAGETDTVILPYSFTDPDSTRWVYGYVDTRENIDETPHEDNNVSGPLSLNIAAGTLPSATLTTDPVCSAEGDTTTITVRGQGWPAGNMEIWYDGNFKASFPNQTSWSRDIIISGTETIAMNHTIQAINDFPMSLQTLYYIPCSAMGTIDGYTWIFIKGDVVPHARTDVECRDQDGKLIAQTTSDDDAYYTMQVPSGGPYTVIGKTYVDGVLYEGTDTVSSLGPGDTIAVNLVLVSQY